MITKKHPCQQDAGDPTEQEFLAESSEYDWLVIDTALDVISGLGEALGPQSSELWKIFEKHVCKFAGSSEHVERSTAVGVIADCVKNMGANVTPYTSKLLQLLMHRLTDEDPETKSNAVYGIGQLIEQTNDDAQVIKQFGTILQRLEPLLQDKLQARMLDNAAGCVSRMILKHRDHVPVAEVLPALVELLPLKEDYDENEPIFRMIVQMCKFPCLV